MEKGKIHSSNKKIIAVIGPTASGKTSLAIEIAKKFDGELINTDSRQIYKYMDIGTAKGEVKVIKNKEFKIKNKYQISKPKIEKLDVYELEGAVIHLINIVKPDEVLTLAQYQKLAYAVIEDIIERGKLPILVGGTGLYIDAITKGYKIPRVSPDPILRNELERKSMEELGVILDNINSQAYKRLNESDKANKRRLIRLVEVAKAGKKILKAKERPNFNVLYIQPKRSREELYEIINKRAKIIVDSGLIGEVKSLIQKRYEFTKPAMSAISYPIVRSYLDGKINKDELIEQFAQGDRNYARRQVTWFKRYDAVEVSGKKEASKVVRRFLRNIY
ncbi:tRNA dimethylallyltransferase [Candidatus Dojkabacteria bacterium]|nr:tRNA dimethylallyltransferase [Candidatus Dojkabacteria bacterium]